MSRKTANDMIVWHNTMMALHCEPTPEEKRKKIILNRRDRQYADFCIDHPESTQEERMVKYQEICNSNPI